MGEELGAVALPNNKDQFAIWVAELINLYPPLPNNPAEWINSDGSSIQSSTFSIDWTRIIGTATPPSLVLR